MDFFGVCFRLDARRMPRPKEAHVYCPLHFYLDSFVQRDSGQKLQLPSGGVGSSSWAASFMKAFHLFVI